MYQPSLIFPFLFLVGIKLNEPKRKQASGMSHVCCSGRHNPSIAKSVGSITPEAAITLILHLQKLF